MALLADLKHRNVHPRGRTEALVESCGERSIAVIPFEVKLPGARAQ